MALKDSLKSSNAITDWVTIALGVVTGALGFFQIIPDLQAAASLGTDVSQLIAYAQAGAWAAALTVVLKLWNTISHILKKA